MTLFCHILTSHLEVYMAHIFWHSIPAFYLTLYSDILFWHSIWHPFWHLFWHVLWHSIWHSFRYSMWHLFWHSFWHLFWHSSVWHSILARKQPDICHILWYFFWHMYLSYFLTFFLAFDLVYLGRFFVVEVRRGRLCRACSWGPAEEGGWGGPADIKSNNLHLTGGEQVKVMKTFFDGDRPFLESLFRYHLHGFLMFAHLNLATWICFF